MQPPQQQSTAVLSTHRVRGSLSKTLTGTTWKIPLHVSTIGEEEIAAALDALKSTQVTSGARVRALEDKFGSGAVMCNSGSSANLLAISALCNPMLGDRALKEGDEVIVPALAWPTTIWPIVQKGLIPHFVDCDLDTFNMSLEAAWAAVGERTRAIMPIHVYGNPCDLPEFREMCDARDIFLIEDCCEALGAEWHDCMPVGVSADIATFSFYFSHHITTLEGGMAVAQDSKIADIMLMQRAHGWVRDCRLPQATGRFDPKFTFLTDGYNLRATELAASIGHIQLDKLPRFVKARRAAARRMCAGLHDTPYIHLQKETAKSSWFGFPIRVDDEAPFSAAQLRAHLETHGIETRPIIAGNMVEQPGMQQFAYKAQQVPNAANIMRNAFSVACHQDLTVVDTMYMVDAVRDFLKLQGVVE